MEDYQNWLARKQTDPDSISLFFDIGLNQSHYKFSELKKIQVFKNSLELVNQREKLGESTIPQKGPMKFKMHRSSEGVYDFSTEDKPNFFSIYLTGQEDNIYIVRDLNQRYFNYGYKVFGLEDDTNNDFFEYAQDSRSLPNKERNSKLLRIKEPLLQEKAFFMIFGSKTKLIKENKDNIQVLKTILGNLEEKYPNKFQNSQTYKFLSENQLNK